MAGGHGGVAALRELHARGDAVSGQRLDDDVRAPIDRLFVDDAYLGGMRHGEAVAIDSLFSSLIAEAKGLLPAAQADELLDLYRRLGLPCSIEGITAETYKRARDEIVVHRDGLLRARL